MADAGVGSPGRAVRSGRSVRRVALEGPIVGLDAIGRFWEAGRDGADEAFELTYEVIAVEGDAGVVRVAVDYGTGSRWKDLWVIRFGADGRCSVFEEWPFARVSPTAKTTSRRPDHHTCGSSPQKPVMRWQAAVGRDLADVDAGEDRGAVGAEQLPAEAELVVVLVDAGGPAHAEAGELGVDGGDHLGQAVVAVGVGVRVDVATVLGEHRARSGSRGRSRPSRATCRSSSSTRVAGVVVVSVVMASTVRDLGAEDDYLSGKRPAAAASVPSIP